MEEYNEYLCPEMLFRYFIRITHKGVIISNEECDALRIEFAKYLHNLNLTQLQKDNILPKSEFDVILNKEHPLRVNGFPPAYVWHFCNFVEKAMEEMKNEEM